MKEPIIVTLVVLFILVLVLRMLKAYFLARRISSRTSNMPSGADADLERLVKEAEESGKIREALRNIGSRAHGVKSASTRSAYYCAAGNLAQNRLKRPGVAAGFYLKALRADPSCIDAMDKVKEILAAQKRFRRLEWTYWEVLGRLDDVEVGGEMWTTCWSGLAAIYAASPRTVHRADAIRRALAAFGAGDGEGEIEEISQIPKAVP